MLRPLHVWSAFVACLAMVAIALGWLTYRAVQLERAEAVAREQMAIEENARLALWRMDTTMATLVAQESARPYFAYQPFYGERISTHSKTADHEPSMPSPLMVEETPLVRLHFQVDARGHVTSPRAPAGPSKQLAVPRYLTPEVFAESVLRCEAIGKAIDPPELMALLPESSSSVTWQMSATEPMVKPQAEMPQQLDINAEPQQQVAQQQARSSNEYRTRSQLFNQNQRISNFMNSLATVTSPADGRAAVMSPVWAADELLLARKIMIDGSPIVQACWLDMPAIRAQLLESIGDLLPAADLKPAKTPLVEQAHLLASLPLELVPGAIVTAGVVGYSPMQLALLIAWIAFSVAAAAVAMVMFGVVSLSERRASFVSAVTHELRTPLTTFRLYSEMLAENMVPDEAARAKYLGTLKTEADRLMHLVENVLAYARLERGRIDKRIVPITVGVLLERSESRLAARSQQAGLQLVMEAASDLANVPVLADASAVEQILFNLVDNACKYAATASDRTLTLFPERDGHRIAIRLRDHGPGIEAAERAKLFRPFHKSAHEAAVTAPDVGLGLALSRRLARAMGGDLVLDRSVDGTQLSLLLNLAKSGNGVES